VIRPICQHYGAVHVVEGKIKYESVSYVSSGCIFTVALPITALNWMMSSQRCTKVSPAPAFPFAQLAQSEILPWACVRNHSPFFCYCQF